jgi:hypothetical protein
MNNRKKNTLRINFSAACWLRSRLLLRDMSLSDLVQYLQPLPIPACHPQPSRDSAMTH